MSGDRLGVKRMNRFLFICLSYKDSNQKGSIFSVLVENIDPSNLAVFCLLSNRLIHEATTALRMVIIGKTSEYVRMTV